MIIRDPLTGGPGNSEVPRVLARVPLDVLLGMDDAINLPFPLDVAGEGNVRDDVLEPAKDSVAFDIGEREETIEVFDIGPLDKESDVENGVVRTPLDVARDEDCAEARIPRVVEGGWVICLSANLPAEERVSLRSKVLDSSVRATEGEPVRLVLDGHMISYHLDGADDRDLYSISGTQQATASAAHGTYPA